MAGLNFDDFRELGKFQLEAMNSASSTTARGWKAIAAEATDYSKQSLDNSRAYFEKMLRVQKIDDIMQLQSEFYRNAYGDFFARASRVGELCSNLAKEAFVSAQATSEKRDQGRVRSDEQSDLGLRRADRAIRIEGAAGRQSALSGAAPAQSIAPPPVGESGGRARAGFARARPRDP